MALKGLDIFKLSPKTNCKDCGCPTCMAFCMKVAQGALPIEKCPHFSADAIASLSEATAPPMKTIKVGDFKLGGETVMFRHDKTFVSRTLYANALCDCMDDAEIDARLAALPAVDYERIGERMYVEFVRINHAESSSADAYAALVNKVVPALNGRGVILSVKDLDAAAKALEAVKGLPVILNAADESNYADASKLATGAGVVLGVSAADINALYDTVAAIEALCNKNLILDVTGASIKEAFANAVRVRRASLKDNNRTFGYPSLIDAAKLCPGDSHMQGALLALFTARYGSIVVIDQMDYAKALPLYGLRQNLFTDPQKPMKVEPGIYPLNGADENAICATTVDFALTYFVVTGEMERSGVPVNLLITDAGGYSVLTAWAAGKLSASSIAKFITERDIESKIKSRTLLLPGKVAVLKGELEAKLPGWEIVVAPNEAVQLVKFLREFTNK
ncbi:MAG: acetyl-CoA decarbonylase/synthase complex subunit gamma [Oscillospiraceae bacterium]|nr:acetyl-CoA decarbonylase/synthase complex subunit gamma [Oscillospiraceae bacterium]